MRRSAVRDVKVDRYGYRKQVEAHKAERYIVQMQLDGSAMSKVRLLGLAFHQNGRPRGWLRKILLKDKKGTPRASTRRLLFKKNGAVRPAFDAWYAQYQPSKGPQEREEYVERIRRLAKEGHLASATKCQIVTTKHTLFVGEAIAACLAGTRLSCEVSTKMPSTFDDDLYIIVCPQMFRVLPPNDRTIMFQMEQSRVSHWFNLDYLDRLTSSLGVLDYSVENIRFLRESGLLMKQLYYVPIQPVASQSQTTSQSLPPERDIDVLFYGAISSERRRRYLDALAEHFNLRIESNLFGEKLRALLRRTKIVVNIHFYEDALLETTRISEALSHGARVVSEVAVDQSRQSDFADIVTFVPSDDVDAFVVQVRKTLELSERAPNTPALDLSNSSLWGMRFMLLRALHGIGILNFDEIERASAGLSLGSRTCMLCLPEDIESYDFGGQHLLPGAWRFPGLRNVDGWKGCAESYEFMARRALADGVWPLTIYEDDAEFETDTVARIACVHAYLAAFSGQWDVFSGLPRDLGDDANVISVEEAFGERFAVLDAVAGMVFGVYNESALRLIADFVFTGDDTAKHSIDRYLEHHGLICVTTERPIVRDPESIGSKFSPAGNIVSVPSIDRSTARLSQKIALVLERARISSEKYDAADL